MDTGLLKTLGQIAGIGGLSIGLALLVFRDVIRKNIFPKFKDESLAYRLLRLIVVLSWTIAVLGIAAWLSARIVEAKTPGTISVANAEFSGDLEVASMDVILSQYVEIHGGPLADPPITDELNRATNLIKGGRPQSALPIFENVAATVDVPAVYNNLGALYAINRQFDEAEAAYERAIELDPEYQVVQLNLGMLEERKGNTGAAVEHLKRAGSFRQAGRLEQRIEEKRRAGGVEAEANDDIYRANLLPLEAWVEGSVGDGTDSDFYEITTPVTHRDYLTVELENQSTTLRPGITAYYANKQQISYTSGATSGQDIQYRLVVAPSTKYSFQVWSRDGTVGAYQIRAQPERAYDPYEPNDDFLHAASASLSGPVEASIMDAGDTDFYKVEAPLAEESVSVAIRNLSTSLRPGITAYGPNKQQITYASGPTSGQDLAFTFGKEANAPYYLQIWGRDGTAGAYRLEPAE